MANSNGTVWTANLFVVSSITPQCRRFCRHLAGCFSIGRNQHCLFRCAWRQRIVSRLTADDHTKQSPRSRTNPLGQGTSHGRIGCTADDVAGYRSRIQRRFIFVHLLFRWLGQSGASDNPQRSAGKQLDLRFGELRSTTLRRQW